MAWEFSESTNPRAWNILPCIARGLLLAKRDTVAFACNDAEGSRNMGFGGGER